MDLGRPLLLDTPQPSHIFLYLLIPKKEKNPAIHKGKASIERISALLKDFLNQWSVSYY